MIFCYSDLNSLIHCDRQEKVEQLQFQIGAITDGVLPDIHMVEQTTGARRKIEATAMDSRQYIW